MSARKDIDLEKLHRLHADGVSVLQMAKEFGVSRRLITRRLEELGLPIRSASEANRLRMSRMNPAERRALTAAANASRRRHIPITRDEMRVTRRYVSSARTREWSMSAFQDDEWVVVKAARAARIRDMLTQVPVGAYNLDFLFFGNVAVEVHSAPYNPLLNPRLAQRTVELLDAGWHVGYLWHPARAGADNLLAWAKSTSGAVPAGGEYWMVRGDGEPVTVSRDELHERASIWPPRRVEYALPGPSDLRVSDHAVH